MIQRAHLERPLHAVHVVKLGGHLAQLLGMHDLEEFFPLGAQAAFLRTLGLRHGLAQRLQARVFAGPGFNFTGENNRRRWSAANHRGIRSLQGGHLELFVQRSRENHIGATVIAGDHAEYDGAFEIHHGPANLGAIFKLQPAHRFRRAIET